MTVTEFLLDRIAEDEHRARAADSPDELWRFEEGFADSPADRLNSRYDPSRVLAECAAKRAIIELAGKLHNKITAEWGGGQLWQEDGWQDWTDATAIVRTLAAIHDSHPDYDETWKP